VPERGEHLLLFDDEHPGRDGSQRRVSMLPRLCLLS
jgi:hypothetical protein